MTAITRTAAVVLAATLAWSVGIVLPARACSCAEPEVAQLLASAADGTTAIALVRRLDTDGGVRGTVEVQQVLAGPDLPEVVSGRFDDGASCDPWLGAGQSGVLVLEDRGGDWSTTTCGNLDTATAIDATDTPVTADPRAGPARLLLAGSFGDGARLAAVDDDGLVAALGTSTTGRDGDASGTLAVTTCPGDEVVVEVAVGDHEALAQRWRASDLTPIGAPVDLGMSDPWLAEVRCNDPAGAGFDVALGGDGGRVVRVTGSTSTVDPRGNLVAAASAESSLVVVHGRVDQTVVEAITPDGSRVLVDEPDLAFDQVAIAPDGSTVALAGYVLDDDGGYVRMVVSDDGDVLGRDHPDRWEPLVGFRDDDTLIVADEPEYLAAGTDWQLRSTDLEEVGSQSWVAGQRLVVEDGHRIVLGSVVPTVLDGGAGRRVADPLLASATDAVVLDTPIGGTRGEGDPDASLLGGAPAATVDAIRDGGGSPISQALAMVAPDASPRAVAWAIAIGLAALTTIVWRSIRRRRHRSTPP